MKKQGLMFVCILLAIGWLSDAGILTFRVGAQQTTGIPYWSGHVVTAYHNGYATTFSCTDPVLQQEVFGDVLFAVNGQATIATRLGNGWLFSFQEKKGIAPSMTGVR